MKKEDKIFDSEVKYTTDFRNVRYPRLEFRTGKLHLVLPLNYEREKKLLEKHKRWVIQKNKIIRNALKESENKELEKRSDKELKQLILRYHKKNPYRIRANNIYFRKMISKWASCSSRGNIIFNTLLKYLPTNLIKYIVYHELIHLKEKRHNSNFWRLIKVEFKDYEKKEKDLLIYWFLIQKEIRNRL